MAAKQKTIVPYKESEVFKVNEDVKVKSNQVFAKTVHLAVGVDLLGSVTSLQARHGTTLEVTPLGVIAISGKNGRKVLIPFPNIKACELA